MSKSSDFEVTYTELPNSSSSDCKGFTVHLPEGKLDELYREEMGEYVANAMREKIAKEKRENLANAMRQIVAKISHDHPDNIAEAYHQYNRYLCRRDPSGSMSNAFKTAVQAYYDTLSSTKSGT